MLGSPNPNQLIAEGWDDLFSVVGLMRAHVEWPQEKHKAPVYIHMGNGVEEILKPEFLTTFLKSPVIKRLGVLLDADANPHGRYDRVRTICRQFFPALPPELPPNGLIAENADGNRFGLWIMPDNASEGCLEIFLRYLIADETAWKHAVDSVETARSLGCPCRQSHVAKANLYTWLAWQDPPGQSPGESLTKKILDPHSASATPFVTWFRTLYDL